MNEATHSGLNENHVRHVVATFRYMDELLSKAEHIMASAGTPSPFQEYADDTTPLQRRVAHDHVVRLRELMSRNLEELHIPRPAPVTGALWAARNAVTFANIALADMESKALLGYGKLPKAAAERVDAIVAELRAAVDRLVADWARKHSQEQAVRLCDQAEVPCGIVAAVDELFRDPHYAARGNIVRVNDARAGALAVPNVVPRLTATPGAVDTLGPGLGQHNSEVYGELLGLTAADLRELESEGVI